LTPGFSWQPRCGSTPSTLISGRPIGLFLFSDPKNELMATVAKIPTLFEEVGDFLASASSEE
jgi:hypothetical protein